MDTTRVQDMMIMYYNKFRRRFTTGDLQLSDIDWKLQLLQDIIWFVLVMEIIFTSTGTEGTRVTTPLRAFMDDIF